MAETVQKLLNDGGHAPHLVADIIQLPSLLGRKFVASQYVCAPLNHVQGCAKLVGNPARHSPDHGNFFLIFQTLSKLTLHDRPLLYFLFCPSHAQTHIPNTTIYLPQLTETRRLRIKLPVAGCQLTHSA